MSGRHRRSVGRGAAGGRPPRGGVGRRPPRRRGPVVFALLAVVAVLGASAFVVPGVSGRLCLHKGDPLQVQAAPSIAPVLGALAADVDLSETGCREVVVTAAAPGTVARHVISDAPDLPDVWVPDSSAWPYLARESGAKGASRSVPTNGVSLASSPVVLAVSKTTARSLPHPGRDLLWADVFGAVESRGLRLALPDPRRYAPAAASLVGQAERPGPSVTTAPLSAALRSVDTAQPGEPDRLLEWVTSTPERPLAAPVPEQEVWAHNARSHHLELEAVYDGPTTPSVDYPFLVLTHDQGVRRAADALLRHLRTLPSVEQLQAAGFRTSNGFPGPGLTPELGVRSGRSMVIAADPKAVTAALRAMDRARRDSRMLAVLDISGSMAELVSPGTTRMDVARRAAADALGLLSDESQAGLWVFSTDVVGRTDFRQLVELGSLRATIGATPRRRALGDALAHLTPRIGGGTALYDTALAAVRTVRKDWSPQHENVVVLFTDGRNDVKGGIGLPQLLSTLRKEADPARPVPVFAIGLGADADGRSLAAIASATGGASYVARTPLDARRAFFDAIGRQG